MIFIDLKKEYIIISILPIMMIVFSLTQESIPNILLGLKNIILSNNILVSDYFEIGNIGAAFFNSGLITLINIYLLYKMRLKLNGLLIVCIFLITSFGFMGKNLINIIPFYIGTYIYTKIYNKPFKSIISLAIMASTLAPVVSVLYFPVGFLIAVLIGVIMPLISPHTLHYHNGYSLYNSGISGGLIGIILYSFIKGMNYNFTLNNKFYTDFNLKIYIFFTIYFIILIIIGIYNEKNFKFNIKRVYSHTGRLVTDFVQREGFYISIFNMGILGILCIFISYYFKLLNGPIICSMLTVVGFGGFGKHLKNVTPILIGVILANYIFKIDINTTSFVMTLFFSTTLAPIAGKFGVIPGIIAGFIHYSTSIQLGIVHGGLNLYNNGLAAGIVASIFVPIAESVSEGGLTWKLTKRK